MQQRGGSNKLSQIISHKPDKDKILDYTPDEILTQVELELPVAREAREKIENDRIIIKQLIANIEKNRLKWLSEEQAEDPSNLSKMTALRGIKDRVND